MKHSFFIVALLCSLSLPARGEIPDLLEHVFAPVIVGTPPSDAFIGLSLMADGEVRHYNYGSHPKPEHPVYLSSRDGGRTWKSVALPYELPYADIQSQAFLHGFGGICPAHGRGSGRGQVDSENRRYPRHNE